MEKPLSSQAELVKLDKQIRALQEQAKALQVKERKDSLSQIVALARKHKISIDEISEALGSKRTGSTKKVSAKSKGKAKKTVSGDGRSTVAPKYRNPDDASQTWTGRGIAPTWAKALKETGKLEDAMIANSSSDAETASTSPISEQSGAQT